MIFEFIAIYLFGVASGIFLFGLVIIGYCLDGGEVRFKYEEKMRDMR